MILWKGRLNIGFLLQKWKKTNNLILKMEPFTKMYPVSSAKTIVFYVLLLQNVVVTLIRPLRAQTSHSCVNAK